jgi:SagB-type dehydrogenase family enzyme
VPPSDILYRRSPNIVSYWLDGRLVFHNFATGGRVAGTALTIGLLDYFHDWRSANPLVARSSLPAPAIRSALTRLVRASLLQQSDRPMHASERAMEQWSAWNPAAGFFHFSTKDVPFAVSEIDEQAFLQRRAAERPVPPPTKTYSRGSTVTLPAAGDVRAAFSQTLRARRTWRRFGREPLSLAQLSVLLQLTFGAEKSMDLGLAGPAMLRSSPSAGARNPLEAYVVVRHVSGLAAGIYHYDPIGHRLARLKKGSQRSTIRRHLPGQSWYADASVLVLMTAVFARTEWKYPFPRAYRTVLIEAGHFCQTFCLVATALRLAPFCTAALADSIIERDLRIDGVTESVIYACGVGTRPPGAEWAPAPRGVRVPRLLRSQSGVRSTRS